MRVEKNYYEILGVSSDASQEEIKRRYRELAKKYHPDRHRNNPLADLAEEQLKNINEAWTVLGDPEKRRRYDQTYAPGQDRYGSGHHYGGHAEDLMSRIMHCIDMRDLNGALHYCNQFIETGHAPINVYVIKGNIYLDKKNYRAAEQAYREAQSKYREEFQREDEEIHFAIGVTLGYQGKYEEAIESLKKAISIGGEIPDYLAFLISLYDRAGKYYHVEKTVKRLYEIAPHHPLIKDIQRRQELQRRRNEDDCIAAGFICTILSLIFDCC